MPRSNNAVKIQGSVVEAPILFQAKGYTVCRVRIMVHGADKANAFNVIALQRLASECEDRLRIGQTVVVEGALTQYERVFGYEYHEYVSIVAASIRILSLRGVGESEYRGTDTAECGSLARLPGEVERYIAERIAEITEQNALPEPLPESSRMQVIGQG